MTATPPPPSPAVRLSIERLVVDGYSRLDARRLCDGFAERLDQLAASRPRDLDGLSSGGEPPVIPALTVGAESSPRAVGRSAADALWRELGR